MSKKSGYPPLELIQEFEACCPGIYEKWDNECPQLTEIIRDKYSEIRRWDVGERFCEVFRRTEGSFIHEALPTHTGRNRPRTHWRRAHWHSYWTGPGKAIKELRFVPPSLINSKENNADIPVVRGKIGNAVKS